MRSICDAAPVLAEFQDRAEIIVGRQDRRLDPGLLDFRDLDDVGHVGGIVQFDLGLVGQRDPVDDRGRGRDQVEVELALQPLLDDLEMQQPEEAAAEAEAERRRGLHLVGEARVVEPQPAHRRAQILEIGGVDGEQAAEHHRLRRLEAGQRLGGRALVVGDRVADAGVGDLLDLRGDVADLAGAEFGDLLHLRPEHADPVDLVDCASAPIMRMRMPFLITPSMTRTSTTTPR